MGTTLSSFQIVVTVLALAVGALNVFVQTGKILNTWPLPQKVLPYLVVFGSFIGGAYGYLKDQTALTSTAIFYALAAGVTSLLFGVAPGAASHVFGLQVNKTRPAPTPVPPLPPKTIPAPPPPPANQA